MRHSVSRSDYERLFICRYLDWDPESQECLDAIAAEYPTSTSGAAAELRARGLNATVDVLGYLVKRGAIDPPEIKGRNRVWDRQDIDAAAVALEDAWQYTSAGFFWLACNLDGGQVREAELEAFAANPHLPSDSIYFVATILPGAEGAGVPARISYRPMTDDEVGDLKTRIEESKA